MMMRKMVIAMGAFAGIAPMSIVIQTEMGQNPSLNNLFGYARFITYVVTMIGSWIYVKWTHTAPAWLIALWINSMSAVTLLNMLAVPNAPYVLPQIAVIIVALLKGGTKYLHPNF